jgi:putative endonuclease
MGKQQFYVYILASRSRTLYVGVTNDLRRRLWEHREGIASAFTSRYKVFRLVWFQATPDVRAAISWEKRIKGWRRSKKIALIEATNPTWEDLGAKWFGGGDSSLRSE